MPLANNTTRHAVLFFCFGRVIRCKAYDSQGPVSLAFKRVARTSCQPKRTDVRA